MQSTLVIERQIIEHIKKPVGLNISNKLIVDGRIISYDNLTEKEKSLVTLEQFNNIVIAQHNKINQLTEYIKSFSKKPDYIRICTAPDCSPVSTIYGIHNDFIQQIKNLKLNKIKNITVVVPIVHCRTGKAKIVDIKDYINLINDFTNKVDVTIEVGNELNTSIDNGVFISEYIDPIEYAQFYIEITKNTKAKLIPASTSGIDVEWTISFLNAIANFDYNVSKFVPIFGIHPYREFVRQAPWPAVDHIKNSNLHIKTKGNIYKHYSNYKLAISDIKNVLDKYNIQLVVSEFQLWNTPDVSIYNKSDITKIISAINNDTLCTYLWSRAN